MFERFTQDTRALVQASQEHARRLGHRYVGGEHLLLAAVSASQPASAVMCAQGVTPERVEEEIVRRVGLGAGAGLFGGLDRDALATIGIDLDAVRARIEASFGPQALSSAAQAAYRDRRRRPGPRPPRLVRNWRRRRRARSSKDPQVGVEHVALALTAIEIGLVPDILSAAGTSAPRLRAAILDRHRQAS